MNLSTQNREKYHSYLNSYEWHQKKSQWVADGRPTFCFACEKPMPYVGARGFNFHHQSYDNLFNENFDDLVLLCSPHHAQLEVEFKLHKGRIRLKSWTWMFISQTRVENGLCGIGKSSSIGALLGEFYE